MAVLLEAVARAREAAPSLHLRMVGEAPDAAAEDRWRALTHELGLDDAVAFEPATDRAGVAAAMRRAGMFVHPSPWEPFGIVAAEALASGLPIATRRSGGVEEIVAGIRSGVELADPDDAGGLAAAILRLRSQLDAIDGAALRAAVVTRYAPDRIAEAVLAQARLAAADLVPLVPASDRGVGAAPGVAMTERLAEPFPERILIVGLRRAWAARRIASLPEGLAARLVAVTVIGTPGGGADLPPGAHWLEIDPDVDYARRLEALGGLPRPGRGGPATDRRGRAPSGSRPAASRAPRANGPGCASRRAAQPSSKRHDRSSGGAAGRLDADGSAPVAQPPVSLIALDAEDRC